ncbi:MAG: TonB-dependent receptor plug domain-containing protein [Verrucomicrobia bacterium]|nr:TonB-dependent receptor plug domain-containing protein [Verrucomicrobiota bacterium]
MAATAFAQEPEPTSIVLFDPYYPVAQSEAAFAVSVYASDLRTGAFTLAEGLRLHPAYFGTTATENDSNGGNGSARIALRGLGPRNTLTLINGRRAFGLTDLSAILLSTVDRTEILSDGAGTLYGASGVAGVANVILLNGPGSSLLTGFEAGILYGNTTDRDSRLLQGFVRGGFSNEKLSFAFGAEYYDREAIFSRDRALSASVDRRAFGGANSGSPTFPGRVTLGSMPRVLIDPTLASPQNAAAFRTYGGANSSDPFNFRASTPVIPAQEKYTYYLAGQYRIFGKGMVVYADVLHAKTKQENGLSGTPFTLNRAEILASPFNPFVASAPSTSPNRITSLSYRLTDELGPRASFYDTDYWRYTLGLRGEFALKEVLRLFL